MISLPIYGSLYPHPTYLKMRIRVLNFLLSASIEDPVTEGIKLNFRVCAHSSVADPRLKLKIRIPIFFLQSFHLESFLHHIFHNCRKRNLSITYDIFCLYLDCWILIRIFYPEPTDLKNDDPAPKNEDPDPQHCMNNGIL